MIEELIVKHCSPTLAGLKTGNMFSCPSCCEELLFAEIRRVNICLRTKGVRLIPLKKQKNRMLLYFYRQNRLQEDLSTKEFKEFIFSEYDLIRKDLKEEEKEETRTPYEILEEQGYENIHSSCCIAKLIKKMKENKDFPHEVGLFLGYPPEDVDGFIKNKDCKCKCVGCWKVYGDEKQALKIFEKYKKCTEIYCKQWKEGKTLDCLCVAS